MTQPASPPASRSPNRFQIGIFAANCSGGIAATTCSDRWEPTWENNVELAQMADEAGIEFMLPLGRWAGYGGTTDHNATSFETITWAGGIMASTKRIMAFGTVHCALLHPVSAAKQMTTVDHIGGGRFGLNLVCGWNPDEFGMFGATLEEHERRYDLGQEWLDIVKRLWTDPEPFDFDGEFFHLKRARAEPKPVRQPIIMCAGGSPRGIDFSVANADYLFRGIPTLDMGRDDIIKLYEGAKALGRSVGVFTNAYVVCRPTHQEAEEYHRWYADECADDGAVETMFVGRGIRDNSKLAPEVRAAMRKRLAGGNGALPIIGTPDEVADQMRRLSELGLSGIAMGLVNYVDHFPYVRDEVLPRLERLGLRQPAKALA